MREFQAWRWFLFFGGLYVVWWVGGFVVRLLAFAVEGAFLTTKNVMYFLVAIRVRTKTSCTSRVAIRTHKNLTYFLVAIRVRITRHVRNRGAQAWLRQSPVGIS